VRQPKQPATKFDCS